MTEEDITVQVRLKRVGDKTKGFADVTLSLGEWGIVTMQGFSVSGNPAHVVPPGVKGTQKWFDIVLMHGKVKALVWTRIGMEYRAALAAAQTDSQSNPSAGSHPADAKRDTSVSKEI